MPMAAVTLALIFGIALARAWNAYNFAGVAAGTLLLLAASALALYRNRLAPAWAAAITAVACCGMLLGFAHRDSFPDNDIRALLNGGVFPLDEPLAFDGCVIEESELRETDSAATIEFRGIQQQGRWIAVRGKGILSVNLPNEEIFTDQPPALLRGDRVRGWAVWRKPRNYENPGSEDRVARLARRGVFLLGRAKSFQLIETLPGDCASRADRFANAVRGRVRESLKAVEPGSDGGETGDRRRAILASLIIGDYSGLSSEIRETFQNTGTFHVLVVSGMHVAWIAGVLFYILRRFFIPERVCLALSALAVFAYACVVGSQASIARCLWVFILFLAGRLLFRRADAMNILFASALFLLVRNPDWLMETGFQLSFLSVAAIVLTASPIIDGFLRPLFDPLRNCGDCTRIFTRPGRRHRIGRLIRTRCELLAEAATDRFFPWALSGFFWFFKKAGGAALAVASMIVVSTAVQLWIEPLLARYFNRLSWIGPLANVVVVPLSSLTLAAGIAGAAASSAGVETVIRLAGSCAALLSGAAEVFERIPGAWQRCPTLSGACVAAGILMFLLWGLFSRRGRWIPCLYAVILLACAAFGIAPLPEIFRGGNGQWPKGAPVLKLTFLDVGQGDAIVIRFPNGLVRTLDAGGYYNFQTEGERAFGFDVGEAVVSRYLWHEWVTALDSAAISHTDSDHAGGLPALMKNFRIKRFDYTPAGANSKTLERLLGLARRRKISENIVTAGMEENIGGVVIHALHPAADAELLTANESSLVFHLTYKHFSALLTGDLEKSGEAEVLRRAGNPVAQLLKAAHHGGRSSTSDLLLEKTRPRWAVISAGRNNPYGHPSPDVLTRLKNHAVRTFVTMDHGAVTYETDGERYVIRSHVYGVTEKGEL
ncbi:MAG: ComEC/Rec2 family competence protein [Acidobacteriota bacterium]|nr:ComEC/Rec2 family competence protein [Acidobacteriota bacterium]